MEVQIIYIIHYNEAIQLLHRKRMTDNISEIHIQFNLIRCEHRSKLGDCEILLMTNDEKTCQINKRHIKTTQ